MDFTGREEATLSRGEADRGSVGNVRKLQEHEDTLLKRHSGGLGDSSKDPPVSQLLSQLNNSEGQGRTLGKGEETRESSRITFEPLSAKRDGELLTATPSAQDYTSPSEDVSLNIGVQDAEERGEGIVNSRMKPDSSPIEERRVAFLPPPRLSPVFIPPRSSYPIGNPPIGSAYGTPPMGQIGVHYPREVIRIERDYSGGELVQFYSIYPMELEGRITPTQWLDTVNGINEILISAHSLKHAAVHHILSVITLYISTFLIKSHYDKEMNRLHLFIDQCNKQLYHSQGLNILWPRSNGLMFMEIEYY